jgi:hypothetical protein
LSTSRRERSGPPIAFAVDRGSTAEKGETAEYPGAQRPLLQPNGQSNPGADRPVMMGTEASRLTPRR